MALLLDVRGISLPRTRSSRTATMGGSSSSNTAQIQALLDKVGAMGGGEVVLNGVGTYLLSGTVVINYSSTRLIIPRGMTLKADANASFTSYAKADQTSNWQTSHVPTSSFPMKPMIALAKYSVTSAKLDNIVIEGGGTIDGNGANQTDDSTSSYCGVFLNSCTRSKVWGLKLINFGNAIASIGTGQRAYCIALFDSDYFDVAYNEVDRSRYDCIGGRGITLGGSIRSNLIKSTTGVATNANTKSRAGIQWAYQGDNVRINDNDFQVDTACDSGHAILFHGSRRMVVDGNRFNMKNAAGGACVYTFGDNTNGAGDTADDIGTYPSATFDEYGEQVVIRNNQMNSASATPNIYIDTRFSRDILVDGNLIEHNTTSAGVLQIAGEASGNPVRRVRFVGNDMRQLTNASFCPLMNYVEDITFDGNIIRKTTAANHMFSMTRIARMKFIRNQLIGPGGDCRLFRRFSEGANGCTDWEVRDNWTRASSFSQVLEDDSAANHTGLRMSGNDWSGCSAPTTGFTPAGSIFIVDNIGGIVTHTAGTGTVANGKTTSGNIAHGLTSWRTLRVGDIRLTYTNSLGNATRLYVSSIDATNFVVTANADPGATTATFSWEADASLA